MMQAAHTGYVKNVRDEQPFTGEGEYGLGWQIGKYRGERVIYHHGGYAGYNNHFSYLPDKKIAVGIAVNTGGIGRSAMQMVAAYVYDSLLGVENVEADYTKRLNDMAADF